MAEPTAGPNGGYGTGRVPGNRLYAGQQSLGRAGSCQLQRDHVEIVLARFPDKLTLHRVPC